MLGVVCSVLMTPIYRARTSVQLEGFNNEQVTPITNGVPNATPENYLQNQVKVLESDTLAKRVAESLPASPVTLKPPTAWQKLQGLFGRITSLSWLPWIAPPLPLTPEGARMYGVKKALSVRTSLQSQVIELFFDSPDPQRAAQGANAAFRRMSN